MIRSRPIAEWKRLPAPEFERRPTVFALGLSADWATPTGNRPPRPTGHCALKRYPICRAVPATGVHSHYEKALRR